MANKYTTKNRTHSRNYEKMAYEKRTISNPEDEDDAGIPVKFPPRNQNNLVKIVKDREGNRYKLSSRLN